MLPQDAPITWYHKMSTLLCQESLLLYALLAGCLQGEIPQSQEPRQETDGSNPSCIELMEKEWPFLPISGDTEAAQKVR